MQSQIRLGSIFGIKIGLHYSWFLIALLIVFSLSGNYHASHPLWHNGLVVALALATAFLFFVSLLLHELSHSLVAKAHGIPVREITLFALGGVSQIEKEAESAKDEFWIAIVGPATSALIGVICVGAANALRWNVALSPAVVMLSWLGYINLGLAVFNMLPGYPMDGGRIVRAIIWWKTGDLDRSTRTAARAGQVVATVFIAIGIIGYFRGGGLGSLWIAFIGWFILQAAKESYVEVSLKKTLEGVRVSDVMTRHCPTVNGFLSIQDFVENELLPTGQRCFIVVNEGGVTGLVTPHEIKLIHRDEWPVTSLNAAMLPLEKLRTVKPDAPLLQALEVMGRDDLNQLPVLSNGHLEGILSRERILTYLQTRMELQGS